jgi:hypothetical protein
MALAVIVCALAAGGIGTIVNRWLIGWVVMVVMAGVCLCFMATGIFVLAARLPRFDNKQMSHDHQQTPKADHLCLDEETPMKFSASNGAESLEAQLRKESVLATGKSAIVTGLRQSI